MTKTERLDKLFAEWEKKENKDGSAVFKPKGELGQFIRDGIVCEKTYETSSIKVLFVLRDPHDANPEFFYPRGICDEVMQSDNSGMTWNRIAEWARALVMGKSDFCWARELKKECHNNDEKDGLRKYFKQIAIMNLKKASEKNYANGKEIELFAKRDCDEIIKEIKFCAPDLIIACGTMNVLKKCVVTSVEKAHKVDLLLGEKEISKANFDGFVTTVVEYRHPGQGCSAEKSYSDMLKIREHFFGK